VSTSASAVSVAVSLCSVFYNELGRMPEMGQTVQAAMLEAKAPRVMETADVDAERSGVRRSSEACLGVVAAWSGAVGGLLLVMLLVRLFG